jgi:hypothetical protein
VPRAHHPFTATINEIRIAEDDQWRKKIIGQLQHYKKKVPFFKTVTDLVSACLYDGDTYLSQLNVKTLEMVCIYLVIPFHCSLFSEMDLTLGPVEGPGDWALVLKLRPQNGGFGPFRLLFCGESSTFMEEHGYGLNCFKRPNRMLQLGPLP